MDLIVRPAEELSGELVPQPSKLHTQFASAVALLAGGKSVIENPLRVKDTQVMLQAAEAMGATVKRTQERWSIWGVGGSPKPAQNVIDARNSGTALSLLTSIAALAPAITVLNGDAQLRSRPMPALLRSLRRIGADVHSTKPDDSPPFIVFGGKVMGGKVQLGEVSAQYLPALLLPCPYAKKQVKLSLKRVQETQLKPILELTKKAGVEVGRRSERLLMPNRPYRTFNFRVPQELAAAAPFIVATALTNSKLKLRGVKGLAGRDASFLDLLRVAGLKLHSSKKGFIVEGKQNPRAAKLDLSRLPELLPLIAVVACKASGKTLILNAGEARTMKSDRISAIARELRRMGARVLERHDGLFIEGAAKLKGCEVDGHDDYAVVAALVVAGLLAEGETKIKNGVTALRTSYSRFISTFQGLGANISHAI
ncbi:MAG: 3-phosphoshikimate 1-carboxyvinyltransferase [Candidatus Hadarchaeaceae archaeon]